MAKDTNEERDFFVRPIRHAVPAVIFSTSAIVFTFHFWGTNGTSANEPADVSNQQIHKWWE